MDSAIRFFSRLFARTGIDELGTAQFPEQTANRLRRGQLCDTIEQMRIMLLGNTVFAPTLSMQAWNMGQNGLVVAWTAVVLLYSWWLYFSWLRTYESAGTVRDMP